MRIAFLIMNHRHPAQLMRLVGTLRLELPEAPIVVHNDKFRTHLTVSELDGAGDIYLLTSDQPIRWGSFGIVDAIWRSTAWMIKHIDFDWLILLSAQDYPIKPLSSLGSYLGSTGADVLLDATPVAELGNRGLRRIRRRRYYYQYRPATTSTAIAGWPAELRRWLRRHAGLCADVFNNVQPTVQVAKMSDQVPWRIGLRARSTPFTKDQPCWIGTTWISMSHRAAEFVVTAARERPEYVEYYRRTMLASESVTATLVCNAAGLRIEPRDIHHVRWTQARTGHPDVLTAVDLPELLAAPEHEFFARKFDIAEGAAILDELDRILARSRTTSYGASSEVLARYGASCEVLASESRGPAKFGQGRMARLPAKSVGDRNMGAGRVARLIGDHVTSDGDIPVILMYHSVTPYEEDPYRVTLTPMRFERQMSWLHRSGVRGASMQELLDARASSAGQGLVGLTFDDGYADFAEYVMPVLRRYGFSATVYVIAGRMGRDNEWDPDGPRKPLLAEEQVRRLAEAGIEIGSHGLCHVSLPGLPDSTLAEEIEGSRRALQAISGQSVPGFCYPYGDLSSVVAARVRAAGYRYACAHWASDHPDQYAFPRTVMLESDSAPRLCAKGARHWMTWGYGGPGALRLRRVLGDYPVSPAAGGGAARAQRRRGRATTDVIR